MPSLITLLGSCFVAASVAGTAYSAVTTYSAGTPYSGSPADRPDPRTGEPWWSSPPSDTGPKVTEYPAASAARPRSVEAGSPGRGASPADVAPDPPRNTLRAAYEQDAGPAYRGRTRADDSVQAAVARSLQPQSPPSNLPAAPGPAASPTAAASSPGPALSPPTANNTSAAPAAPQESAPPLGLGSHNIKPALGKGSPLSAAITVGGSLAIVLGLFFVVAWAMRKAAPHGSLVLPKEVFEILGRAPLGARQQVQLLRCGNKLLLVSITPGGTETLTEITDPLEVDRLAGICQQAHPKSSTTAFRQVFQDLAPKSGEAEELDQPAPAGTRRKRYRWEEKHA